MEMGLRQTQRQGSRLGMGLRTFAGRQRGGTQPARQSRSSKRGEEDREQRGDRDALFILEVSGEVSENERESK